MKPLPILLALAFASSTFSAESGPAEPASTASRWWKGNLHTHSFWSDGDDFPEMITAWYQEQGYHFLAISDHNVLQQSERWLHVTNQVRQTALQKYRERFGTNWVEIRPKGEKQEVRLKPLNEYQALFQRAGEFLLIQAEELTDKFKALPVHLNASNIRDYIPPQGGESVREVMQNNVNAVLDQARRTGQHILPHLNHPNFVWGVTAEDLAAVRGEKFFEVYNGHPQVHNEGDAEHASTDRMWDIALALRLARPNPEPLFGIAVDDSHHYHTQGVKFSNAGRGWIFVRASHLTPESLLRAMERGDFYASSGVVLKNVTASTDTLNIEIEPEPGIQFRTQFIGTRRGFDAESHPVQDKDGNPLPVTRRYSPQVGELLAEVEGHTPSYRLRGDELYVRARVLSSKTKANPGVPDEKEMAWTQPLFNQVPPRAEASITHERSADPSVAFRFKTVGSPAKNDAGAKARFSIRSGSVDPNSGGLGVLNDGQLPSEEDAPRMNFFFAAGTKGGEILVDLGEAIPVRQVRTYSWHAGERGPQFYKLFAATDLDSSGWTHLADVDTRPKTGEFGGQYGVSIGVPDSALGSFRYLRFEIHANEDGPFGNAFFSEIDIVGPNDPDEPTPSSTENQRKILEAETGNYRFTFDLTAAPDLAEWTEQKLIPIVKEWYPKLVAMLPSDGFEPATNVTLRYREDMGGTPASAGGNRINCNAGWFRRNLQGEAAGSVVHEMVHVVQNYGRARRNNPDATRTPGWIVEGIPDYIRWFLYEPETKGAEITARNLARARHDASYRITGNFLNWVVQKHGDDVIPKLNAAARQGKYTEAIWNDLTGKSLEELGNQWKSEHERRLAPASTP